MTSERFADEHADERAAMRARLAAVADELRETERIAAGVGTDDMMVASLIKSLGFDGDSSRVFDLLPLIHVAWADGTIELRERERILDVLELRNLGDDTSAFRFVESLLEERPAESWMELSRDVLRDVLKGRDSHASALVDLCVSVANASSGMFGHEHQVGADERELIRAIAETLGPSAKDAFKAALGE